MPSIRFSTQKKVCASSSIAIRRAVIEAIEPRLHLSVTATDDQMVYAVDIGAGSLVLSDFSGTPKTTIPISQQRPAHPSITPDRKAIVYSARPTDVGKDAIWTIHLDGTGETRLTNDAADDTEPSLSPDGSRIAFVSNRDGNSEIYVMNADGTHQTRLTNNSATDKDPVFSPDGTKILFSANTAGNYDLYTMDSSTGGSVTRLTNNPADDTAPAYSPEGLRIAFVSKRDNNAFDIWMLNASAVNESIAPVQLDHNGNDELSNFDVSAAFSPDGTQLAVSTGTPDSSIIHRIDADTGSELGTVSIETSTPAWASQPRFSGLSNMTVTVLGTSGADRISIVDDDANDNLVIMLNGKTEAYPSALIQQVQVFCGAGNDTLDASQAAENIYASGDAGDDELIGGFNNDTLTGGSGRNTLFGGDGDDRLNGSGGRDFLYGENGNDRLYGNAGNDYMVGGAGVDRMWGGDGDDLLSGNSGNDKLFGENGSDQLLGGDGNDNLDGGAGIDTLNGGKGADTGNAAPGDLLIQIEMV